MLVKHSVQPIIYEVGYRFILFYSRKGYLSLDPLLQIYKDRLPQYAKELFYEGIKILTDCVTPELVDLSLSMTVEQIRINHSLSLEDIMGLLYIKQFIKWAQLGNLDDMNEVGLMLSDSEALRKVIAWTRVVHLNIDISPDEAHNLSVQEVIAFKPNLI